MGEKKCEGGGCGERIILRIIFTLYEENMKPSMKYNKDIEIRNHRC